MRNLVGLSSMKNGFLVLILPILFLVVSIATLTHYGNNWDEPFHFHRGQAYLHYLLTGNKNFNDIPPYPGLDAKYDCKVIREGCDGSAQGPVDIRPFDGRNQSYEEAINERWDARGGTRRSYFQAEHLNAQYFLNNDEEHPPVGGILAAFTNKIFYQKLKIIGDIDSHHLFEILASFMLVVAVAVFVFINFGLFPSVVSAFSLSAYPLFFAESHFNIKDPPLASFYGITLILFYFGVTKNTVKYIYLSAITAGLGLGVKFNILFAPLIVIPWLVFYLFDVLKRQNYKLNKNHLKKIKFAVVAFLLYIPVVGIIFYSLWPFLWSDPVNNIVKIFGYYRQIGSGTPPDAGLYLIKGWNTYPIVWIFYTTPIPILILSAIGFFGSIVNLIMYRKHIFLFMIMWLIIPIIRVSVPGVNIYGGVRQLMEYIPAMAIMSGVGAYIVIKFVKNTNYKKIVVALMSASLLFVCWELVKIHPNENVYFNQLIGGLKGAEEKEIPSRGNTYGNVYYQGIDWLNKNAEPNAKAGFPLATMGNLPKWKLRTDIDFSNTYWSGPDRKGEYELELNFEWAPKYWYSFQYYDTYLEPVYEVKVNGVSLLKVWKNDLEHTKKGYEKEVVYKSISQKINAGKLEVDFGKEIALTRVIIKHDEVGCDKQIGSGFSATSLDGIKWERESDPISYPQVPITVAKWNNTFDFLYPAKKTRYLLVDTQMDNSCILRNPKIEYRGLEKLVL